MNIDKNLVGGSSALMLLTLLREKDRYGYEIIKELRSRSDNTFDFKEGTLYPLLHKLESRGYVRSYETLSDSGRKRTYYAITGEGSARLEEELRQWETFSKSVNRVIGAEPAMA